MCLGSGFNPFLWWRTGHTGQPLAAFYSQRNATRNLPAANPFPQQSCLNLETCDVNVLDACMVDQGEEGVEMAAAGREGINQLRSGLNCTALTVQCRRQDLSPPKTRTCPNCSAIQYPQSAPRHRITASLNWPGSVARHQKFGRHTGPLHDWQSGPGFGHKKGFCATEKAYQIRLCICMGWWSERWGIIY